MDKKAALIILINHSYFLSDEDKKTLLSNLSKLDDEQVEKLGKFLALEKKQSIEQNQNLVDEIEELIKNLG